MQYNKALVFAIMALGLTAALIVGITTIQQAQAPGPPRAIHNPCDRPVVAEHSPHCRARV